MRTVNSSAIRALAYIIGFCILPNVPALAATGRPCAEELEKYCKDVPTGNGRLLKCLKEHDSDLSPACRECVGNICSVIDETRQACTGDVAKFCKDVKEGGGRIAKCLKGHAAELTPQCREKLASVRPKPEKMPPQEKPQGGK